MKKQKINSIKKTLIAGILALLLIFSPVLTPKTHAFWGEFIQEEFHFVLLEVRETIKGTLMGALKKQAVQMLNNQVDSLVGGGSGGEVAFITDWEDYLVNQAENRTQLYINDYLTQITSGRGSRSGYSSEGFIEGFTGVFTNCLDRYCSMILSNARNSLRLLLSKLLPRGGGLSTRMTYERCPGEMFISNNFKDLNRYLSGINNPWAFDINLQNEYQKKLELEKEIQQTKAMAYGGFTGTTGEDGSITYPGSLTKENTANAQNVGNLVVATAKSVPEVITSVVSQVMTRAQQGFSGALRSAQKDASTQSRVDASVDSAIDSSGPGAMY